MKYASKKVELSFICERAPAKLLPKMHRRTRWSRSVSDYDSKSISRASIERRFMSAIIQASPLEKLSQEPLPTGDSCALVIFGASGDLTRRKLIPGLYNLACVGCMNPQFEVLGVGRTPMRSEEFRAKLREEVAGSADARNFTETAWRECEHRLGYSAGDANDRQSHGRLKEHLNQMQRDGSSPNRLFYIA